MTVLEAILCGEENCDRSHLTTLRGRVCGGARMLDGDPVLACITPITDESHKIER
jgi:hypothetical protein